MDPVTASRTQRTLDARQGTSACEVPYRRWIRSAGGRPSRTTDAQLNESPHAQELPAFGLSIVKPCFSIVSAKSIVAPSR